MAVIFVLHGMGKHDKGWWGGENGTLKELKSIRRFDANRGSEATIESLVKDKKEGGDIEWIELNYDDLAEHLRNSIKEGNGFDDLIDDANERADALRFCKLQPLLRRILWTTTQILQIDCIVWDYQQHFGISGWLVS